MSRQQRTSFAPLIGQLVLVFLAFAFSLSNASCQTPPPYPSPASNATSPVLGDPSDYEVLTHGVIHEAFVDPASETTEPRATSQKPPAPIKEQPPSEKPDGHNIVWIPGYWAWDWIEQPSDSGSAGRRGFVWVSGLWRDVPPGRRWVEGNWSQTSDGQYQWNAGYWLADQAVANATATATVPQTVYLPEPPGSLDRGPNSPSPGDDCFWIPGCWRYRGNAYAWTAGYWARQHPGWVWTPSRYVHTPHGCVFVEGYWDYEPVRRGSLFGVVVFRRATCYRPSYVYCPARAVSMDRLVTQMYVDPHGCFCYGDHHGHHHFHRSYCSVHDSGDRWRRTTPLVSYFRWQSRKKGLSVSVAFGTSGQVARGQSHGHRRDAHQHHHDVHDFHHDHRYYALGAGNRRNISRPVGRAQRDARGQEHDHDHGHDADRPRADRDRAARPQVAAETASRTNVMMARRGVRSKAKDRDAKQHHHDHEHEHEEETTGSTAAKRPTTSRPATSRPAARKSVTSKSSTPKIAAPRPGVEVARQAAARHKALAEAAKRAEARRSMLRSSRSKSGSPALQPSARSVRPSATPPPKRAAKPAPKPTRKPTAKPSRSENEEETRSKPTRKSGVSIQALRAKRPR